MNRINMAKIVKEYEETKKEREKLQEKLNQCELKIRAIEQTKSTTAIVKKATIYVTDLGNSGKDILQLLLEKNIPFEITDREERFVFIADKNNSSVGFNSSLPEYKELFNNPSTDGYWDFAAEEETEDSIFEYDFTQLVDIDTNAKNHIVEFNCVYVQSSFLKFIGYNSEAHAMIAQFHTQKDKDLIYLYYGVEADEYINILKASSTGTAFQKISKGLTYIKCKSVDWY